MSQLAMRPAHVALTALLRGGALQRYGGRNAMAMWTDFMTHRASYDISMTPDIRACSRRWPYSHVSPSTFCPSLLSSSVGLRTSSPKPRSVSPINANTPEFDGQTTRSFLQHASIFMRIAAAAYVFQVYVANCTMSIGPSMQPTLNERGDILITEAVSPYFGKLRKGDMVIVTKPTDGRISILKRIHALPGDILHIPHHHHHQQPTALASSSSASSSASMNGEEMMVATRKMTVPEGHVWLLGDNPAQSTDSRYYGAVPMTLVRAKVVCRVWPLRQAGWLSADPATPTTTTTTSSSASSTAAIAASRGAVADRVSLQHQRNKSERRDVQ